MILLIFLLILILVGETSASSSTSHLLIFLGAFELLIELILIFGMILLGVTH